MFQSQERKQPSILALLNRLFLFIIGAFLLIGALSTYRAWYQVKSLGLHADPILRAGSVIKTNVVSYARTPLDVRVELVQDSHSEVIGTYQIGANAWPFFDPRTRRVAQRTFITQGVLRQFHKGSAQIRATATGRPQWTRVPPPLVREFEVEIPQ